MESNWWARYSYKDFPPIWQNPHMVYIWDHAPPDRRDAGKMAIGVIKEFNTARRKAKYNELKRRLEGFDVFIPMTAEEFVRGKPGATQVLTAAVMEVFSHTGMYSGGEKGLENGIHTWRYVRDT